MYSAVLILELLGSSLWQRIKDVDVTLFSPTLDPEMTIYDDDISNR